MRVVYGKACSYLTMNAKVTRVMMRSDYNIKIILGSIVDKWKGLCDFFKKTDFSSLITLASQLYLWSLEYQSLWLVIALWYKCLLSQSNGYDWVWSRKCSQ